MNRTQNSAVKKRLGNYGNLPSMDEQYIFISYSHKDKDVLQPILEKMAFDGFRLWFDAGIDPGTEWDENIANHIENCDYFIAFISQNYLLSDNCKDEINYARDLNKQRVLVYLEPVTLPAGMAMRLNRLQAIHYYTYERDEDFYKSLYNSSNIGSFRRYHENRLSTVCIECNVAPLAHSLVAFSTCDDSHRFLYMVGNDYETRKRLLEAVTEELQHKGINYLYCQMEQYTNEMVKAIAKNELETFYKQYTDVSVLILEDVGFIDGKAATQENIYQLLKNRYYNNLSTMIVSSDYLSNYHIANDIISLINAWEILETPMLQRKQEAVTGDNEFLADPWEGKDTLSIFQHKYTQIVPLGRGLLGSTYKAFDTVNRKYSIIMRLNLSVALHSPVFFNNKISISLQRLKHENLCKIEDIIKVDNACLILDYHDGQELLSSFIKERKLDYNESLLLIKQVLSALSALHGEGIIYGDVSSSTMLIAENCIYLCDFLSVNYSNEKYNEDDIVYSKYTSPEKRPGSIISNRSDIYETGVLLDELTLQLINGDMVSAVWNCNIDLPLIEAKEFTDQERMIFNIIKKATRYKPDERYESAQEMIRDIDEVLSSKIKQSNPF